MPRAQCFWNLHLTKSWSDFEKDQSFWTWCDDQVQLSGKWCNAEKSSRFIDFKSLVKWDDVPGVAISSNTKSTNIEIKPKPPIIAYSEESLPMPSYEQE